MPKLVEGSEFYKVSTGKYAHSGTYTNGSGVAITPADVGFDSGIAALLIENAGGYHVDYDRTNGILVARYGSAGSVKAAPPALIVEEAVTVATNVATLAHVPLYIVSVESITGTTTGAFSVIPTGETPLTKQVAVTFPSGLMTFLGTDAVTAARVTYIPKRQNGYLSAVTVDEVVVAAAAKTNLAARAGLVQYVWDNTDNVLNVPEPPGEAPTATHNCVLDINSTGNSNLDAHADDEGNSLKVTYVPYAQLPPGTFIDDTDITLSSEVWNFTGDPGVLGYNHTVVPGFGVNLVGETTATNQHALWLGPSGTDGPALAVWNPVTNSFTTDETVGMTTPAISWMILDLNQLSPFVPGEVATGTLTISDARYFAWGW